MPSEPLSIIQEYLESSRPQTRKNATSALGVLGSERALEALVRRALFDTDPQVRTHAEHVLASTGAERTSAVASAAAAVENDRNQAEIHRLLGRLRNKGLALSVPAVGWRKRLTSCFGAGSLLNDASSWSIRFRPLIVGVIWGLGSAFVIWLFLLYTLGLRFESDAAIAVLASGSILGPLVAVAVSQRANPIGLQFDYRAAQMIELLRAVIAGMIFCTVAASPLIVIGLIDGDLTLVQVFLIILFTGLSIGAVRVGTIVVYGISPKRRLNRAIQTAAGTAAGVLALGMILALVNVFEDGNATVDANSTILELTRAGVVLLVPVLVATAAAFTFIDGKAHSGLAPAPAIDQRIGVAATAFMGLLILIAVFSPAEVVSGLSAERGADRAPQDRMLIRADSIALGGEQHFVVDFRQEVAARLPGEDLSLNRDYVLELVGDDGGFYRIADDPPAITTMLEPGRYHFRAYLYGSSPAIGGPPNLSGIVPALGDRLAARMGFGDDGDGSQHIEILYALNSSPKNAIPSVLPYLNPDSVDAANELMGRYASVVGRTPGAASQSAPFWTFVSLVAGQGSDIFEISSFVEKYAAALWEELPVANQIDSLNSSRATNQVGDTLMESIIYTLGEARLSQRHVDDAVELYETAFSVHPVRGEDGRRARTWNSLCWNGTLEWPVSDSDPTRLAATWVLGQRIQRGCERAVELMPANDPFRDGVRDSRGLIRALTGNVDGALEDFRAFASSRTSGTLQEKRQRRGWIDRLEAGEPRFSVFTPALLNSLRTPSF